MLKEVETRPKSPPSLKPAAIKYSNIPQQVVLKKQATATKFIIAVVLANIFAKLLMLLS